jgi:hypothetical protein
MIVGAFVFVILAGWWGWQRRSVAPPAPGTVHRIVHQTLARDTTEAVGTLQELEVARLDALQSALWDAAMRGDVAAARTAMRIVIARCRLLGLHDVTPIERFIPRTVVLTEGDRAALGL